VRYLLVLNTNDAEAAWNCLRFGAAALNRQHAVTLFLLGPGVEIESIGSESFNVQGQLARFLELGGSAVSCGTCLRSRNLNASNECPISSMDELVRLSEEADKTLTFG